MMQWLTDDWMSLFFSGWKEENVDGTRDAENKRIRWAVF
jgi:hypothetical protein